MCLCRAIKLLECTISLFLQSGLNEAEVECGRRFETCLAGTLPDQDVKPSPCTMLGISPAHPRVAQRSGCSFLMPKMFSAPFVCVFDSVISQKWLNIFQRIFGAELGHEPKTKSLFFWCFQRTCFSQLLAISLDEHSIICQKYESFWLFERFLCLCPVLFSLVRGGRGFVLEKAMSGISKRQSEVQNLGVRIQMTWQVLLTEGEQ